LNVEPALALERLERSAAVERIERFEQLERLELLERLEPGGAGWVRRGPLSQRDQRRPGKVAEVLRETLGLPVEKTQEHASRFDKRLWYRVGLFRKEK
jgi:hypothetical protein